MAALTAKSGTLDRFLTITSDREINRKNSVSKISFEFISRIRKSIQFFYACPAFRKLEESIIQY